jgi:hypothetical protein
MTFKPLLSVTILTSLALLATGCCGPAMNSCGCGPSSGLHGVLPMQIVDRTAGKLVNPCGDGCGEVYYDERINHPPVCDPCGGCSDLGSCQRPILTTLRRAWGMPYVGACECATPDCTGCSACGGGDYAEGYSSMSAAADCPSCAASQQHAMTTEHVHATPRQMHAPAQVNTPSHGHAPTPAVRKPVSTDSHGHVETHDSHDAHDAHGGHDANAQPEAHGHAAPAAPHDDHHASQAPRRMRQVSTQRMMVR